MTIHNIYKPELLVLDICKLPETEFVDHSDSFVRKKALLRGANAGLDLKFVKCESSKNNE